MAHTWEFDKNSGKHKLTITVAGHEPQIFTGMTKAEIADQLADAQTNATTAIDQLKAGRQPARRGTKPLEPGERMQLVSDLGNPAKVDTAVERIVEAVVGPVADLREAGAQGGNQKVAAAAEKAAAEFADGTPDWWPSAHNKKTLAGYMRAQGMDPRVIENYRKAFAALTESELLQKKPAEQETPPAAGTEPIAPKQTAPPPTRQVTGVRSTDTSGTPTPQGRRLKYTQEDIAKMSAATYKQLMQSDPELTKCVDYYESQRRQRRTA